MPLNIKRKIYLNILRAEEELLKNNIYHTELGNSPFVEKSIVLPNGSIITTGHSHILVNPFTLNIHIIDLDGQSTTYTENGPIILNRFNNTIDLKQKSFDDLTLLTLEFLLGIDYEEFIRISEENNFIEFEERQYEIQLELSKKGIDFDMQKKLIEKKMTNIEDFYEVAKILRK